MGVKTLSPKIRLYFTIALCAAWLIGYAWLMKAMLFDANAPLTSENTYQVTVPVDEITFEIRRDIVGRSHPSTRLFMYVGDVCYTVEWHLAKPLFWPSDFVLGSKEPEEGELLNLLPQLKSESELTLTVFEDAFILGNKLFVVDVRSPTTVYFDIAIMNDRHATDRAYFPVVIIVFFFIFVWGLYQICRKFLPNEYRKTFSKIEAVVNKVFKKSQKKKKSNPPVVPTETPPDEKRIPCEGAVFRDEE